VRQLGSLLKHDRGHGHQSSSRQLGAGGETQAAINDVAVGLELTGVVCDESAAQRSREWAAAGLRTARRCHVAAVVVGFSGVVLLMWRAGAPAAVMAVVLLGIAVVVAVCAIGFRRSAQRWVDKNRSFCRPSRNSLGLRSRNSLVRSATSLSSRWGLFRVVVGG